MYDDLKDCENFYHDKYGYCYYSIEKHETPLIYNLFIEERYRKQGHARRILQFVINEILKTGYTGLINIEAKPKDCDISVDRLVVFYKEVGLNVLISK